MLKTRWDWINYKNRVAPTTTDWPWGQHDDCWTQTECHLL